jgi:phosphoglycolate phosphatase
MVGDTTVDVKAARRAGAWSAAVLCGFGERQELERAGAHVVLNSTADLQLLLL